MSKDDTAPADIDPSLRVGLPASQKVYIEGSRPDLRVAMRCVMQSDTPLDLASSATSEANPPIYLYDTSGAYTDPDATIDIEKGLPPLRS
ncbi:MAG: phosphomethylpyrimidine synthase ThiC, partial [Alphaproteobacteria bacterium]|nr:phosphomethylpyrimidine synthase ThiC [Alphaproteobacteria bacterium]